MILYNIGQHFSFTTYIDKNLRPVIINIMKSEVSLVVYNPHALAKYTQEPWLYSPLPLTKDRSFVGRA